MVGIFPCIRHPYLGPSFERPGSRQPFPAPLIPVEKRDENGVRLAEERTIHRVDTSGVATAICPLLETTMRARGRGKEGKPCVADTPC